MEVCGNGRKRGTRDIERSTGAFEKQLERKVTPETTLRKALNSLTMEVIVARLRRRLQSRQRFEAERVTATRR